MTPGRHLPRGNEIDINIGTARNGRVTLTNVILTNLTLAA